MIIDIHTHVWPEKVSLKARESLEAFFKLKAAADPTVDNLVRFMDKNKVDISVVCAVASRPEQVKSINDWAFSIRSDRVKVFASLHPDYPDWSSEMDRIRACADGIKFQPEFQNFYVDQENVYPIYEKAQKSGLPILFHCGMELSGTMLVRSAPDRVLKVRNDFPKLKMVAAHFGGFQLWDEVKKYLLGKDIYLDTAFFFDYLKKDEVKKLLLAHSPDRLLFGSDFPLTDPAKDIEFIRNLDIPQGLKEKILYTNAKTLLGL